MNRPNLRNSLLAAAIVGGTFLGANALADAPQGSNGAGYGMDLGMMGGVGGSYGMGSGMMGGLGGSYGMGGGKMRGQGGSYGVGGGMMGGQGGSYGMGPGMMGGYEDGSNPDLTAEQRGRIVKIRDDVRRKHWALMGKMQDEQSTMNVQHRSSPRDDDALSKSYRRMSGYRHEMFDLSLSAQKQIDAVLTPEQREKRRND